MLATDDLIQILIVEDNPGDVFLVREALKQSSMRCEINHVADGEKAVDFLQRRGSFQEAVRPDLVLLDLNLPKRSGWEVFEEMRAEDDLRDVPVVILSSSGAPEDVGRAQASPSSMYIRKPNNFDDFLKIGTRIRDFLEGQP